MEDMDAILDAAFRRVFGVAPAAPTEFGTDTTARVDRRKDDAKAAAARAMAENGVCISQAARDLEMPQNSLRHLARKYGFKFRDGRKAQ